MPFDITHESGFLRIVFSGALTAADLAAFTHALLEVESTMSVLPHRMADLRRSTGMQIDSMAVRELARARGPLALANPIKTAIIAPDEIHYGFARMFQTLNENPSVTIAIFPTEESAIAWLALPGVAPPAIPWAPSR
jgi:hypothetical protein